MAAAQPAAAAARAQLEVVRGEGADRERERLARDGAPCRPRRRRARARHSRASAAGSRGGCSSTSTSCSAPPRPLFGSRFTTSGRTVHQSSGSPATRERPVVDEPALVADPRVEPDGRPGSTFSRTAVPGRCSRSGAEGRSRRRRAGRRPRGTGAGASRGCGLVLGRAARGRPSPGTPRTRRSPCLRARCGRTSDRSSAGGRGCSTAPRGGDYSVVAIRQDAGAPPLRSGARGCSPLPCAPALLPIAAARAGARRRRPRRRRVPRRQRRARLRGPRERVRARSCCAPHGGGSARRLAAPGKPADPAFSPLGRRIAFASRSEIWVMFEDGTSVRQVTVGPGAEPRPDVVAGRRRDRVRDAATRATATSTPSAPTATALRRLTTGRADDEAPAWGPTGAIAFVRDGDVYLKAPGRRAPPADRRRGRRPRPRRGRPTAAGSPSRAWPSAPRRPRREGPQAQAAGAAAARAVGDARRTAATAGG